MIKSFRTKEEEMIFKRIRSRKFPVNIQRAAMRKLWMINAAYSINDLRVPPANRLEKLKGSKSGQYSIRINNQWRICFRWQENNAYDVEIIDYH